MKNLKRFLCAALAASCLFMTACSGGAGGESSPVLTTEGRYVEKDITPPIDGRFISFLTADETLVCFSEDLSVRYDSADGGESWNEMTGFSGVSGSIQSGTLLEDGRALIYVQGEGLFILSTDGEKVPLSVPELDEAIAKGEGIMLSLLQALPSGRFLLSYTSGGMVSRVEGNGPAASGGPMDGDPVGGDSAGANAPDGATSDVTEGETENSGNGGRNEASFSGASMQSKTILFDLAGEKSVAELDSSNASAAAAGDGKLYVMNMQGIVSIYNLEDGGPAGEKDISFGSGEVMVGMIGGFGGASGGSTLARDSSGRLYAIQGTDLLTADTGGVIETSLEGTAYSIGSPGSTASSVFALGDGSLIVNLLEKEQENRLYKYVWDENATIDPEKTLTVWSLEDNSFIRAAIAELRKKHPDSTINYEIALGEDNAVSATDAIKTLNTELLNGSGPDIIVLDGAPADSYADRGMLLDLSSLVDTSDVYENLLAPFGEGGSLYCLPTQLFMPALMGSAESLAKAQTLEELVSLVVNGNDLPVNEAEPGPGAFSSLPEEERPELYFSDLEELCNVLWSSGAPAIVQDNVLDTDALRSYLEMTKAISDKYNLTAENGGGNFGLSVAVAGGGGTVTELSGSLIRYTMQVSNYGAFIAGNLQLLQMMMDRAGSEMALFPGLSEGVWEPSTVVGISADTKVTGFAAEFLNIMLNDDVQQLNYGTGLPVTHSGIALQIENINKELAENDRGTFTLDADALIAGLQTPSMTDKALTEMIWVSVEKYCKGTLDLEGAVKEIEQNVKNYLAERT